MFTGTTNRYRRLSWLIAALTLISMLLAACGSFEVGVELTPTPEPTGIPEPLSYTNSEYGFLFQYPAGWSLTETPNQVSLAQDSFKLAINVQRAGAAFDPAVVGSGMPAGDLIYRGKLAFLDQVIPVDVLEYEKKDKAVYYGEGTIESGGLMFLIRLEDTARIPYEQVEIPVAIQDEALHILESVQLSGEQANPNQGYVTPTSEPALTQSTDEPGTLGGMICYPSENIPAMTAYFQNLENGEVTNLAIEQNQASYQITLDPGEYQVYAYLNEIPTVGGGYTQAVICGLSADCTDHSLLMAPVFPGQATRGIDLCDWYDPSFLPANPDVTEPADPAAAGMVYYHPSKGLYQVQGDGLAHWLFPYQDVQAISPDGEQALVVRNDDIWLADRTTGTLRNLTNTPDRQEFGPQFWPANLGVIVFGSVSAQEGQGLSSGKLTRMNLDGSGYQVLEPENNSIGAASLSPDGETIAYETGDQAWLYRDDTGKVAFDPAAYGLTGVERVISPSWSPDGSQIAWWIGGPMNGSAEYSLALGVFDLAGGDATLLHPYTPIGGDGWPSNPVWDSSGQWLAANVLGENTRNTLWALKVDGTDEVNLGNGANQVWDPQGDGLIYIEWGGGSFEDSTDKLTHIGDWSLQALEMQPGSIPFAWLGR